MTSKADRMGLRHAPMAFTEPGVAMLSSVLNSERAILVNIGIMRAFVQLRGLLASHEDLARTLAALEKKYDAQFNVVFDAIRELMRPVAPPAGRSASASRRQGRATGHGGLQGEDDHVLRGGPASDIGHPHPTAIPGRVEPARDRPPHRFPSPLAPCRTLR